MTRVAGYIKKAGFTGFYHFRAASNFLFLLRVFPVSSQTLWLFRAL